ncbi:MAG: ASCH domain-containing protein [Devosia sp.]|nr:ASCH domain-containing protein [Devosia sp.]
MIHPDIPIKAISIRQPWASLILFDGKRIENRSRRNSYRGPIAIHASKNLERDILQMIKQGEHPVTGAQFECARPGCYEQTGGVIGVADVLDCVEQSDSDWFVGRYGFVLANARPVPFIPCPGALGFFDWRKQIEKAERRAAA